MVKPTLNPLSNVLSPSFAPFILPSDIAPPYNAPSAPYLPSVPEKRKNRRSHDYRQKRRKARKQEAGPGPSSSTYAQVLSHGTAIEVDADATEFPAAKGAVTGKKGTLEELGNAAERQKFYTVVELIQKHGFERIAWDGKCAVLFLLF